jgi:hypothetical protein
MSSDVVYISYLALYISSHMLQRGASNDSGFLHGHVLRAGGVPVIRVRIQQGSH